MDFSERIPVHQGLILCPFVLHLFALMPLTNICCCILHGPGGERIMNVVPGGTQLDLQLRWGIGQGVHTRKNRHVKCTGVY